MAETDASNRTAQTASPQGGQPEEITQEIVNEIADRVFAMLLSELNIERERLHRGIPARGHTLGGWR